MNLNQEDRIEEYVLIQKLSEYSHVWQAFDENGQRDVVLKFVEEKASADREGIILADIDHPNILKLLRRFRHNEVSVLVFEYVPGLRLDKAIRKGLGREESFKISTDICSALKAIHQFGLFHGDLSPFNVIWSTNKNKAYLIDFGAMGECTVMSAAPEHDPESHYSLSPATDMVGFGRILMGLLPNLKTLANRCLYMEPDHRPSADQALKALEKARDRRFAVVKRLSLAAVVILMGLSGFAVSRGGQPTGPHVTIQQLLQEKTPENLLALKGLLADPQYHEYQDRIIRAIAQVNNFLGKEVMVIPDHRDLIAIFALPREPMVIAENGILELGDWVTIKNEYGYVVEVNKGNIIFRTEYGSKEFQFPKPKVLGKQNYDYKNISIYPGANNLETILSHICEKLNYAFVNPNQIDGIISGFVDCNSYDDFLSMFPKQISFLNGEVKLLPSKRPVSILLCEDWWSFPDISVAEMFEKYVPHVGYQCIYKGNNKEKMTFPAMQFHDLVEILECEIEVEGEEISIKEGGIK